MLNQKECLVALFREYEGIDSQVATDGTTPLFEIARKHLGESIKTLLADEVLKSQVISAVNQYDTVLSTDNIETQSEALIADMSDDGDEIMRYKELSALSRLAALFLKPKEVNTAELPEILHGPIRLVADSLVGRKLEFNGCVATIDRVRPQTEYDNRNWIPTRPIFGDNPLDVYVGFYRGNPMLFIRGSERNTCVRITAAHSLSEVAINPKQVCRLLGINNEMTGSVIIDENERLSLKLTPITDN